MGGATVCLGKGDKPSLPPPPTRREEIERLLIGGRRLSMLNCEHESRKPLHMYRRIHYLMPAGEHTSIILVRPVLSSLQQGTFIACFPVTGQNTTTYSPLYRVPSLTSAGFSPVLKHDELLGSSAYLCQLRLSVTRHRCSMPTVGINRQVAAYTTCHKSRACSCSKAILSHISAIHTLALTIGGFSP